MKKILCYVDWEDACTFPNTTRENTLKENTLVRTFGVLEHKDRRYHIVMTHDGGDDDCCDRMRIPSSLVRKITKLREA